MTTLHLDDAAIAEAAFHLWLAEGQPDGRAEDHWFRARTALEAVAPAPKARKATKAAAEAPAAKPRARKAATAN